MRPPAVVRLAFLTAVSFAFLIASRGTRATTQGSSTRSNRHEVKEPEFEIINFKVELDARASTDPFWPKYNGRGAITATVGDQIYEDESYDVYVGYKRENLKTKVVDDSVLYISKVQGLRNFDAPCMGQDPCEYTWTGIRYWNHIEVDAHTLVDVCCLMRGRLKNASDPRGIRPVK
jgi:hypothetical protein